MDPSTLNLTTVTGIVAITMLIVEVLKRLLKNKKWFNKCPIWVYDVIIAGLLAFFSNHVIHKLQGNVLHLVWQSILLAGSSSGFYTWLKNGPSSSASNIPSQIQQPTTVTTVITQPQISVSGDKNEKANDSISDGPISVNVRVRRGRSTATINCTSGK